MIVATVGVVLGAMLHHSDEPPLFNPYEEEFKNRRKGAKHDLFDE